MASEPTLAPINPNKLRMAALFEAVGIGHGALRLQRALLGPHLRAVYFHSVPPSGREMFAAQLDFLTERFVPLGMAEVLALQAGDWPHRRPGLILTFDDGCRSHAEIVAPLLDERRIPGWFFLPSEYLDQPARGQRAYARERGIYACAGWSDERLAMTWQQAQRLTARHVVGCHTTSHMRLTATLPVDEVAGEVIAAKATLEQRLAHAVDAFCWVGGDEASYSAAGAAAVRAAGYRVAFMTNNALFYPGGDLLRIQRTNLEAHYPPRLVRFQLSGALDAAYVPRRARVNRLTAAPG